MNTLFKLTEEMSTNYSSTNLFPKLPADPIVTVKVKTQKLPHLFNYSQLPRPQRRVQPHL